MFVVNSLGFGVIEQNVTQKNPVFKTLLDISQIISLTIEASNMRFPSAVRKFNGP